MSTVPEIQIRKVQMRRDLPSQWVLNNPILADGEFGIERTLGAGFNTPSQFKIGNGVTRWNDLPYSSLIGPPGPSASVSTDAGNKITLGTDGGVFVMGDDDTDLVSYYADSKN